MISITEKKNCCGCTACASICPQNCIEMQEDEEGFLYPKVLHEKCIDCHLCEQICSIQNNNNQKNSIVNDLTIEEQINVAINVETILPESYVVFIKDAAVRENSTSGGFFTAVARYVLAKKENYGVEVNRNNNVIHSSATIDDDLEKYRGSKYVQSTQFDIYQKIKKDLEKNLWVLYSGTPCQCAGLYNFLNGKKYETLIILDIFCHGVGSPKYWEKYTQYMQKKYHSSIHKVRFREKTYGYNSACMAVYFDNGKSSHKGHDDDLYWTAFSKFYIFRPSCYDCSFKTINHEYSDFSVGDYWNSEKLNINFQKANGCSLLLVHSDKGKRILEEIDDFVEVSRIDLKDALIINGGPMPSKLISNSPQCSNREKFFQDMDKLEIDKLVKKYIPLSFKKKIKCCVKPFLYKIGILEFLKNLSYK